MEKPIVALNDILYKGPNVSETIWAPYFWKEGCLRMEGNIFLLSKEQIETLMKRKFPLTDPLPTKWLWQGLQEAGRWSDIIPHHLKMSQKILDSFEITTWRDASSRKEKYIVPVCIFDPHNFPELLRHSLHLPIEVVQDIKAKRAVLVFICSWEGNFTRVSEIQAFDAWIEKEGLGISKSQIWYMTNVLGGKIYEYLSDPARKFQVRATGFFEDLPWGSFYGENLCWGRTFDDPKWPTGTLHHVDVLEKYINSVYYSFDKKFLGMFGGLREHRIWLYYFFKKHPELFENSLVSLRNNYKAWNSTLNPHSAERTFLRGVDPKIDEFIDKELKVDKVANSFSITVSGDTGDIYSVYKQPIRDRCFLEVVTETGYRHNDCVSYTEKTYKAILSKKPFILLGGSYGMLKTLHSMGYETFGDFWDESYDLIEDPKERLRAVGKLLLDINKYSIEELRDLKKRMKTILDRNFWQMVYTPRAYETVEWFRNLTSDQKIENIENNIRLV